jgi:GDP-4-dehydro-6-deoxy-D-mannose reductase
VQRGACESQPVRAGALRRARGLARVRVLVTGSAGFVGGRLIPRLVAAGHTPIGVDREVDVGDPDSVAGAVAAAAPDAVVHLAARSFVPDSFRDPAGTFRVNFLGVRNVLRAVEEHAPRARVLTVSTGNVYGVATPPAPPFDETAPLRPGSPYARAKAAADLLAASHGARGLDVVRVRPFNHTGRGRPDSFVESSLARQIVEIALGRRPARIAVGNLDAVRDFLDVEDVVGAYLRLLDRSVPAGLYNVASGVGRSVREVLETLLDLAGLSPAKVETAVEESRWRPTDHAVGDAARLRAAAGWAPRVAFRETMRSLLEGWRAELTGL